MDLCKVQYYTRSRSILWVREREQEGVMPITLTQQTALITGASRGIGRGIALKLAEQGVKKIAINYKENDAAAEDAARLLKERGAAPLVIKADIGKVADIPAHVRDHQVPIRRPGHLRL